MTNGVIVIMFGNDGGVVWRCGTAPVPGGGSLATIGTVGGGLAATYILPTVPEQHLPASCRP